MTTEHSRARSYCYGNFQQPAGRVMAPAWLGHRATLASIRVKTCVLVMWLGTERELDICDATRFVRALSVAAATGSRIIMNLAGLVFMNCSGRSALASAWEKARRAGGDMVLAAPQQPVARFLSLIDLTGLLPVYASVAVQLELLLRPDMSVEPFGPVGPSVPSTAIAI
jgi:anti-anti-sigma factor